MSEQWIEYEIKVVPRTRFFSREGVTIEDSIESANEMLRRGLLPLEVVLAPIVAPLR